MSTTTITQTSINDELRFFTGTECYYKVFANMVATEGVKALAELGECFWLLNDIAIAAHSLQKKNAAKHEFLVFDLKRAKQNTFIIRASIDEEVVYSNIVGFSDFPFDLATIWVEGCVLLLPSEH